MEKKRIIMSARRFALAIDRLCYQLIEQHGNFEQSCLVGVQQRGVMLSTCIVNRLGQILGREQPQHGKLDITFYRDDFRTRTEPLKASKTEMNFLVENKRVVLVDDVLYTGRTVQAALTALNHYGRAEGVELLCLVDRRFNRHLPIQANYVGLTVDALDKAYVKVAWDSSGTGGQILLFADKKDAND